MSEYSMTVDQVLEHTYYQMKYLTRAMLKRVGAENQRLMNMYRIAYHGKRTHFERYYNSLMPAIEEDRAGKLILPEGFQHIEQ